MNEISLKINELGIVGDEPRAELILIRGADELVRREVRVFSENDILAAINDMSVMGLVPQVDIDQAFAELIEPIRIKWLRNRDRGTEGEGSSASPQAAEPRYFAELPSAEGGGQVGPRLRDLQADRVLANFVVVLNEDIEVPDDIESWREFAGKLTTASGTFDFRIRADDYADNSKLKAALFAAGGCELVIHSSMDELRRAISTISKEAGSVRRRVLTTNFGWTADKSAYLTPSLLIRDTGIEVLNAEAGLRVDLATETPACHLDLGVLGQDELIRVKKHIVEDLLALSDRLVTHTLLGATAAAVLYPSIRGVGRFALWLVGLTGSGKSFAAKLFSNFFGHFPLESASFTTWSATANFIQRQGYFFKDALYLVDDYKPELVKYPQEVVRVLQAYADNTARGRLRSDATANVLRPIRGLLVCTGEDVPEHHASAVARSVIVKVPQQAKNLAAGNRCKIECQHYSVVTADFLRWLLANDQREKFAARFSELQQRYYGDVAGQQNDIRVAANLALLGAAFEQIAEYLGDVWDGWQEAARRFVEEDLVVIRDGMLGEAKEQQASEVFLKTLGELIQFSHVRIDGLFLGSRDMDNKPMIGRVGDRSFTGIAGGSGNQDRFEICTSLALAQVNATLRQQGRAELRITERALLQQLREDGKLLSSSGAQLTGESSEPTFRTRIQGVGQRRVFAISRRTLLDN